MKIWTIMSIMVALVSLAMTSVLATTRPDLKSMKLMEAAPTRTTTETASVHHSGRAKAPIWSIRAEIRRNLTSNEPIEFSISVPQFDIAKECEFEGGSSAIFDQCSKDETAALAELTREWTQFAAGDRKTCLDETMIGGLASYVELRTCLEMARDAEPQGRTEP